MQFPGTSAPDAQNESARLALARHAEALHAMSTEAEHAQRTPMMDAVAAPAPNAVRIPTWSEALTNVLAPSAPAQHQLHSTAGVAPSAVASVTAAAQAAAAAAAAAPVVPVVPGATFTVPTAAPAVSAPSLEEDAQLLAIRTRRVAKVEKTSDAMRDKWVHPPGPQEETVVFHRIKALLEVADLSQSFVCRSANITQGAMSQYMRCIFRGRQDVLEEKLERFIDDFLKGTYDGLVRRGAGRRPRGSSSGGDARVRSRGSAAHTAAGPPPQSHPMHSHNGSAAHPRVQHQQPMQHQIFSAQQHQAINHQRFHQQYGAGSPAGTPQRYQQQLYFQQQQLQQQLQQQQQQQQQKQQQQRQQQHQRYNQYKYAQQQQQRAQVSPHLQAPPAQSAAAPLHLSLAPLPPTVAVERAFHAYHTSKWDNPFSDAEPVLLPIKISVSLDQPDYIDIEINDTAVDFVAAAGAEKVDNSKKNSVEHCVESAVSKENFIPAKTGDADVAMGEPDDPKPAAENQVGDSATQGPFAEKQQDHHMSDGNTSTSDKDTSKTLVEANGKASDGIVVEVDDKAADEIKASLSAKNQQTKTTSINVADGVTVVEQEPTKSLEKSEDVTNQPIDVSREQSLPEKEAAVEPNKVDVPPIKESDTAKPSPRKMAEDLKIKEPEDQIMAISVGETNSKDDQTLKVEEVKEKPNAGIETDAKDEAMLEINSNIITEEKTSANEAEKDAKESLRACSEESNDKDNSSAEMKADTPESILQEGNLKSLTHVGTDVGGKTDTEKTAEKEKTIAEDNLECEAKTNVDDRAKQEMKVDNATSQSNKVIVDKIKEGCTEATVANGIKVGNGNGNENGNENGKGDSKENGNEYSNENGNENGKENVKENGKGNGKESTLQKSDPTTSSQPTSKYTAVQKELSKPLAPKASDTPSSRSKKVPHRSLDFFTQWDVNERLLSPEEVAESIVSNRGCDPSLAPKIAAQIRYRLFEAGVVCPVPPFERNKENRRRISIKVALGESEEVLSDSFDWDICLGEYNSPELFAQHLCSDNGFSQYHVPKVAQEIRRQVTIAQAIAYGDARTRRAALARLAQDDPLRETLPPLESGIRRLTAEEKRAIERNAAEKLVKCAFVDSLLYAVERESTKREIVREEKRVKMREEEDDRVAVLLDAERRRKERTRSRMEVDATKHRVREEHGIDLTSYLNLKLARGVSPCVWLEGLLIRQRKGLPVLVHGHGNSPSNSASKEAEVSDDEQAEDEKTEAKTRSKPRAEAKAKPKAKTKAEPKAKTEAKPKATRGKRGRPKRSAVPPTEPKPTSSSGPASARPRRGAPRKSRSSAAAAAAAAAAASAASAASAAASSSGSATPTSSSATPGSNSGGSNTAAGTASGSERKRRSSSRAASAAAHTSKRARR